MAPWDNSKKDRAVHPPQTNFVLSQNLPRPVAYRFLVWTMTTVVIVTGASRGIGREFAQQLARRPSVIVYAGVRDVRCLLPDSPSLRPLQCDVTSDQSVESFYASISHLEERVDVLINNAGIDLLLPIHDTSVADFHSILETNLLGVHRMIKTFLPLLRNSSKIVNIGSRYASNALNVWKERGAYSVTSAGLNMLTTQYKNVFPDGPVIISIHPGRVSLSPRGTDVYRSSLT